ncbi:MAG: hypothetical protein FWF30_03895 [Coriobacteriia bacterium]|nr:hypothetical protein [Coriobacteriia bacterium]
MILRWRVHDGDLPLRRRHLRALRALELPEPLMGWIHERLEWALINMLEGKREAVLVLDIDLAAEVKLSLEGVRTAPRLCVGDLEAVGAAGTGGAGAASAAGAGAAGVGTVGAGAAGMDDLVGGLTVADEQLVGTVWIERESGLLASATQLNWAADTLCFDLATTLAHGQKREPIVQPLSFNSVAQAAAAGQAFFISDEFGFLPIHPDAPSFGASSDASTGQTSAWVTQSALLQSLAAGFAKVWG